jgi:hypothetical protein
MSEGTFGKLLWTMLYDSDFDYINNGPLLASTQTYYLGFMKDAGILKMPSRRIQSFPVYHGDSGIPQGLDFGKIHVYDELLQLKVQPIDATPFYVMEGEVVANGGDPDYDVSLYAPGETPSVIWHREDNYFKDNQAREYFDCKGVKQNVTLEDNYLTTINDFLPQREYDMDNDSVLRLTQQPARLGQVSPLKKYVKGHPDFECTWVLTGGNIDLTSVFHNFEYTIETIITPDEEEDGNDYPSALQHHGEWLLSNIMLDCLLKDGESQELADLRSVVDKTTGLATGDKLRIKFPRLHANDYLMFEFPNCVLIDDISPLEQASAIEGPAYNQLEFGGHTQVNIQERQTDSAGSSNTLPLAAYELA